MKSFLLYVAEFKSHLNFLYLLVLIFICSVGCEKSNQDNEGNGSLRLSKIEVSGELAEIYEYNTNGLLDKITYGSNITIIDYNSNDLPIKIDGYNFEWNANEIIVTEDDWLNRKEIVSLNSNNQIKSILKLERDNSQSDFDTISTLTFTWTGTTQLRRICTYFLPYTQWNDNWDDNFTYGTSNSPFKGINIAILYYGGGFSEFDVVQNNYCMTEFSDKYLDASISYDLNEQNYPIKAYIDFHDSQTDTIIFEYESN